MTSPAFVLNANRKSGGGASGLHPPMTTFFPTDAKNSALWSDEVQSAIACVPFDFVADAQALMDEAYQRLLPGLNSEDVNVADAASKKFTVPEFSNEIKQVMSISIGPARITNPFGNEATSVQKLDANRWIITSPSSVAVFDESTNTLGDVEFLNECDSGFVQSTGDGYIIHSYIEPSGHILYAKLYQVTGTDTFTLKDTKTVAGAGTCIDDTGHRVIGCEYNTDAYLVGYTRKNGTNYYCSVNKLSVSAEVITVSSYLDLTPSDATAGKRKMEVCGKLSTESAVFAFKGNSYYPYVIEIYGSTITAGSLGSQLITSNVDVVQGLVMGTDEFIYACRYSSSVYMYYCKLVSHSWTTKKQILSANGSVYTTQFVGAAQNGKIVLSGISGENARIVDLTDGNFIEGGRAVLPFCPDGIDNRNLCLANGGLCVAEGCYIASSGTVAIKVNGETVKSGVAYDVLTPVFLGKEINAGKAFIEVVNASGATKQFSITDIMCLLS